MEHNLMLKLFNSLSRTKETFTPIEPGKVRMYVCGMTVYDYCHLGHARVLVVFDVIVRHLRQLGYEVTYVRNITDIDDKIIARAQQNGESVNALTERFIQAMHEDAEALGVLRPDAEPRATDSMSDILDMISKLVDSDHAYQGDNGDVFYSVNKFAGYGQLSGKKLKTCAPVPVLMSKRPNGILWILYCGRLPSRGSPPGPRIGVMGGQVGTSSVRLCLPDVWVRTLTSTVVAWIYSFRIMKTRLPSRKRRLVSTS
jgi:cysteinyl-tRNA synthetase